MTSSTKPKPASRRKTDPAVERETRHGTGRGRGAVEPRIADWRRGGFFGWLGCFVAAAMHTGLVTQVAPLGEVPLLVAFAVPAAATAIALPGARRHGWHRWLAVLLLTYSALPWYAPTVLLLCEVWVLHRFWAVDHPDNPISRLVSRAREKTATRRKRPTERQTP